MIIFYLPMRRIRLIVCFFAIHILYNIGTRMDSSNRLGEVFMTIMLLAACAKAMDQFGSEVGVTFGSVVRIISPQSGFMYALHHLVSTPTISSSEEEE